MKNEMELLSMDERQRQSWLQANRLTLILVGLVWLGMILWEMGQGHPPWFLIVMLPVFALVRLGAYQWFQRRG